MVVPSPLSRPPFLSQATFTTVAPGQPWMTPLGTSTDQAEADTWQGGQAPKSVANFSPSRRVFPPLRESLRWLAGGFAVGVAAPMALKRLGSPAASQWLKGAQFQENVKTDALNVYSYFSSREGSLYRIAMLHPEKLPAILAYGASSVVGFLMGNVMDGLKEAWVRWEESCIRAELLSRLSGVVQHGIDANYQVEDALRQEARVRIGAMLVAHGVPMPDAYLFPAGAPATGLLRAQQHTPVEPTSQLRPWGLLGEEGMTSPPVDPQALPPSPFLVRPRPQFGSTDGSTRPDVGSATPPVSAWEASRQAKPHGGFGSSALARGVLGGFGLLTGLLAQNTVALLAKPVSLGDKAVRAAASTVSQVPPTLDEAKEALSQVLGNQTGAPRLKNIQTVSLYDGEAFFLLFLNALQHNKLLVGSFFALGAMMKMGASLVQGLKEIEVTRLNAATEYNYQQYNWNTLNPHFRQLAERTALMHDLKRLEEDLPWLHANPPALRQRIQATMSQIGLHSAPQYYLSTPMVNLVEARG
jgi:hypothetical protein